MCWWLKIRKLYILNLKCTKSQKLFAIILHDSPSVTDILLINIFASDEGSCEVISAVNFYCDFVHVTVFEYCAFIHYLSSKPIPKTSNLALVWKKIIVLDITSFNIMLIARKNSSIYFNNSQLYLYNVRLLSVNALQRFFFSEFRVIKLRS